MSTPNAITRWRELWASSQVLGVLNKELSKHTAKAEGCVFIEGRKQTQFHGKRLVNRLMEAQRIRKGALCVWNLLNGAVSYQNPSPAPGLHCPPFSLVFPGSPEVLKPERPLF